MKTSILQKTTRVKLFRQKRGTHAQLLIRKLGSFIRLRRVLLLRSDIRLATSCIRYASLGGE